MHLHYLTANAAWVFTYGDQLIPMDEQRFFHVRGDAVEAARRHGLKVERSGAVHADGPNPFERAA